ncbi:Uncharacterized protein PECH_008963 [Penicillium ucsense]|uniref:Methyltransferase domain-containing protein n=1 Tax=Penicillium ucsense TaxID=2839758 RepID=A0A8J8VVT2_9EURO|nr:Uncharacterized protein PECM_005026 [Penicillium ucsense]KAF7733749.1 Uncharacterized protein PECH_008963 [Penicillium ucsense]
MSEFDHAPHTYLLTRTDTEAQRLDRLYGAWQANIKYLLHPAITVHDHACIADIGTGTASVIWLRDLSREVPSSCQPHGFDISAAMFPDRQILPPNVTLFEQDMLQPFPEQFLGHYDVVHVRLMIVALSSDHWAMGVQNLMTLLRPGGWLQWEDCAGHEATVHEPSSHEHRSKNARLYLDLFRKTAIDCGKKPKIAELMKIFQRSGLVTCQEHIHPLLEPEAREDLNFAVLEGVQNTLIAAFDSGHRKWIEAKADIAGARRAAETDLQQYHCWFTYNVHVVIGMSPP